MKLKGKKIGKTTVTIRLASGKQIKVKVKVQKKKVAVSKIKVSLPKSLVMKKGEKRTIKAELVPFTAKEKIRYSTSNKKVTAVSGRGVIKALKKGKAKITVMAGKRKTVIQVKVKG